MAGINLRLVVCINYLFKVSKLIVFFLSFVLISNLSLGDELIFGKAYITDGDTIKINGKKIRLHGIDTPEIEQYCLNQKKEQYPCGKSAKDFLKKIIKNKEIKCLKNDIDRYGRIVATCYIGEKDLNGLIVESGWGLAYRRYSKKYISNEKSAEKEALGLWSGKFIKPWEWRKGKRLKINVN